MCFAIYRSSSYLCCLGFGLFDLGLSGLRMIVTSGFRMSVTGRWKQWIHCVL